MKTEAKTGPLDYRYLQHQFDEDFFRCRSCTRVLTLLEVALSGQLRVCPCGGTRIQGLNPEMLKWWEWLLPRVLRFCWLRYRNRI